MRGAKSGGDVTLLRRISTETAAHSFNSGELFWGSLAAWRRNTRGEMERRLWPLYRHRHGEETAGELIELKRGGNHCAVKSPARNPVRGGRRLAGGSHLSARGEGTVSGAGRCWAGASSGAGPNGFPGVLLYFYFVFFFFFSGFFILLYLLQKCFKSSQTNFIKFLKFKVTNQSSNKQVFRTKTKFLIKDLN
jgi:hypothetical protein